MPTPACAPSLRAAPRAESESSGRWRRQQRVGAPAGRGDGGSIEGEGEARQRRGGESREGGRGQRQGARWGGIGCRGAGKRVRRLGFGAVGGVNEKVPGEGGYKQDNIIEFLFEVLHAKYTNVVL